MKISKIISFSIIYFLFAQNSYSQAKDYYFNAWRDIKKEYNKSQKYNSEDFPVIKNKIAIKRIPTDDDFTNQDVPNESEKKEIIKLSRAYKDEVTELSLIIKKIANDINYKKIKDILILESELYSEKASSVFKMYNDGIKSGQTFAQINKNDLLNEERFIEKFKEIDKKRNSLIEELTNRENDFLDFYKCTVQFSTKESSTDKGYPDQVTIKIKNDENCLKYKKVILSNKVINDFLSVSKNAVITVDESENYRYDIELKCSLKSILFGQMIIKKNGQVVIPECTQNLEQFVSTFNTLNNYYKSMNQIELTK